MSDDERIEAMKRLGVFIEVCSVCQTQFNAGRTPRHWVHMMLDGELVDKPDDGDDLCCSEACGQAAAEKRNENVDTIRKDNNLVGIIRFIYLVEEE